MVKFGIIGSNDSIIHLHRIIQEISMCSISGNYKPGSDSAFIRLEGAEIPVFSSFEAFISSCEAVIIMDPDMLTLDQMASLLKESIHILAEKSYKWYPEQVESLNRIAEEADAIFNFRAAFRFHPVIRSAEQFVLKPAFIDYQVGISNETPAGLIPEIIIHSVRNCLDSILALNPAGIRKTNTIFSPDLFGFPGIIHGRIEFDNGCVANLTLDGYAEKDKNICYVYQENRQAIINLLNNRLKIKDKIPGDDKFSSFVVPVEQTDPLQAEIEDFTEAILNKYHKSYHSGSYAETFQFLRSIMENIPNQFIHA